MGKPKTIDVNNLSEEELIQFGKDLDGKVQKICMKAVEDANKILNKYGLQGHMQIVVTVKETGREVNG